MPGRSGGSGGGSGGPRTPAVPSAVSGPGMASQRTDQVDLTGFDAERHGQRQELEQIAAQTGGADVGPPPSGGGGGQQQGGGGPGLSDPSVLDVFRPADASPAPSFGYQMGAAAIPDDPDLLTRALYNTYPHPDLLRMLDQRRGAV